MLFRRFRMRRETRRDERVERLADEAFDYVGNGNFVAAFAVGSELRAIGAPACADWLEENVSKSKIRHEDRMREVRRGLGG